jgi:uncharacterized membrane protein/protein-disulfide isomerase
MSPRGRWLVLVLALLGFGLAVEASWVHYRLLTDPSYISPCDINATFSCSEVYLSRFGTVWGVPVALGGLVWFGLVALVAGFARADGQPSASAGYLFALSTIGLAVVLYLAYASFVVLDKKCVLCLGQYACVGGIFLATSFMHTESLTRLPARLARDLRATFSRPATLSAAVLYAAAMVAVILLFPKEGALAAQAAATTNAPPADAVQAFTEAWAKQPRVDLGVKSSAAVVIVKFNDYECPTCRVMEEMYRPILDKFAKSNPGQVDYVMKDWPWNAACNFNTASTIHGHEAACDAAAAARMARDRGKYQEMADWLFANQGTTPAAVRDAAQRLLGVTDFDAEYAKKLPDIRRDIADGGVLQIRGTPTFFINGVRFDQLIQPQYFELAIQLELAKKKTGSS